LLFIITKFINLHPDPSTFRRTLRALRTIGISEGALLVAGYWLLLNHMDLPKI